MTAIELYAQAYNLQYHIKDYNAAQEIYQDIIQKFPETPESSYAQIQMQKLAVILEKTAAKEFHPGFGSGFLGLAGLLLSLASLGVAIGLGVKLAGQSSRLDYTVKVLDSWSRLTTHQALDGIVQLETLIRTQTEQTLAYKVLAGYYLGKGDLEAAEKVLLKLKRVSPDDKFAEQGLREIVQTQLRKRQAEAEVLRQAAETQVRQKKEETKIRVATPKKRKAVEEEFGEPPPAFF